MKIMGTDPRTRRAYVSNMSEHIKKEYKTQLCCETANKWQKMR